MFYSFALSFFPYYWFFQFLYHVFLQYGRKTLDEICLCDTLALQKRL